MELSRRDVVKLGLLGGAALYLPMERVARTKDQRSLARLPAPYTYAFSRPPEIDLRAAANGGTPGDEHPHGDAAGSRAHARPRAVAAD